MNKKLLVSLLLLAVLSQMAVNAKKHMNRKDLHFNPHVVHQRLAKIKNVENKDAKAEELFNAHPDGHDKYEQILEGDVFLLNTKTASVNLKQSNQFQLEYLRLNKHALYYNDKEKSYRGVIGAIQLEDLVDEEANGDNIKQGKCCQKVSAITKKQISFNGDLVDETSFDCFTVTAPSEKWELCFPQFSQALKWKQEITKNILTQGLEKLGIFNFNFIAEAPKKATKYTWLEQQHWGGSCQTGQIQSPAKINKKQALYTPNLRMKLNFVEKGVKATAVFDGYQQSVIGSFGTFAYQEDAHERTFSIERLQFKFPSEHYVNGNRFDGEMLVFGNKVGSGQKAILSIMIAKNKEAEINEFVDALQAENWILKYEEGKKSTVKLDHQNLTLNNIVKGGVQENFRKSFFYYQGSYSDPPCEEGVFRFVMTTPMQVTPSQFDLLKSHSYFTTVELKGNARDAIEFDAGRTLYYHSDKSEGCESNLLNKVKNLTPKSKAEQKKADEIAAAADGEKKDACDSEKAKGQFVKATTSVTTYAIVDEQKNPDYNLPIGKYGNGLEISEVLDEKTVPEEILEKLQEQAKVIDEKNCEKKHKKSQIVLSY